MQHCRSPYAASFKSLLLCALLLLVGALLMAPQAAQAQSIMVGGNPISTDFSCNAGVAVGNLLQVSSCADGPQDGKVFSYFVCQFEQLLNEVLSQVYCAVAGDAKPAVLAALTLLVVLSGAAFLMGVLPFTAKELMVLAAKFSLVLAFATQAEYMIGIGYNLFVNMAKEGIVIVLRNLLIVSSMGAGLETVDDVYGLFDTTLQNIISLTAAGEQEGNQCKDSLFVMLITIAAVIPPLAFVAMYAIVRFLWMLLRAIFGYCQGLLGLTFLVVLSPIYVSFALFKPTRSLFDKWIQHLISFAFQMVIVFAFLGMVFYMLSQMADDTKSYTDLVKPYKQDVMQGAGILNFADTCGICEMEPVDPKEKPKCKEGGKVLPLSEMTKNEEFLRFMTVKVVAMLIIFYILDIMLGFVPELARHLAGPKYAGQLGGGAGGNMPMPGERAVGRLLGRAGGAFAGSSNSASGTLNAVRTAVADGIVGDRGLIDGAIRSVANPNDPFRDVRELDDSPAGKAFSAAAGLTAAGAALGSFTGASASGDTNDAPAPSPDPAASAPAVTASRFDRLSAEELDQAQKHLAAIQNQGKDITLATSLANGLANLPENPSAEQVRQVISTLPGAASRADLLAAIDMLNAVVHDNEILEELRVAAGMRT